MPLAVRQFPNLGKLEATLITENCSEGVNNTSGEDHLATHHPARHILLPPDVQRSCTCLKLIHASSFVRLTCPIMPGISGVVATPNQPLSPDTSSHSSLHCLCSTTLHATLQISTHFPSLIAYLAHFEIYPAQALPRRRRVGAPRLMPLLPPPRIATPSHS